MAPMSSEQARRAIQTSEHLDEDEEIDDDDEDDDDDTTSLQPTHLKSFKIADNKNTTHQDSYDRESNSSGSRGGGMENSSSHSSSHFSTGTGGSNITGNVANDMLDIAARGDKVISASRGMFFSVLFIAAVVLATVAFLLYRHEETKNFERAFTNQAEEIVLYTNHNVDTVFATIRALSTTTTTLVKSTAEETGLPSGFVTLPDLSVQLELARNTTSALVIAYMPKVFNDDYQTWVNYSETNKYWISEEQPEHYHGGASSSIEDHYVVPIISPFIWDYQDDPNFTFTKEDDHSDDHGDDHGDENEDDHGDEDDHVDEGDHSEEGEDDHGDEDVDDHSDEGEDNHGDDAAEHTGDDADEHTGDRQRRTLLRGGGGGATADIGGTVGSTVAAATAAAAANTDVRRLLGSSLQRSKDCSGRHWKHSDHYHAIDKLKGERRELQNMDPRSAAIDEEIEMINGLIVDTTDEDIPPEIKMPSSTNATYYAPVWQMVPIPYINETSPTVDIINYNLVDRPVFSKAIEYMASTRLPTFLDICDQSAWFGVEGNKEILQTVVAFPVFADFLPDSDVAGYFTAIIPWMQFFDHQSRDSSDNVTVVMENTCDEVFTIKISGGSENNAFIVGEEDLHDPQYDSIKIVAPFAHEYNGHDNGDYEGEVCVYTMSIYATESFADAYHTNRPAIISMLIVLIFLFTSLAFMLFDCLVTRRQARLLNTALRQNAIVSSLFPKSVHKKLMEEAEVKTGSNKKDNKILANRLSLGAVLNNDGNIMDGAINLDSKPIADLFPKTTIMFADISGFTAWSSAREPEAVFTLLETIYRAFDMVAKRRRVFKVEVVGDCYVAVCGLPDPRKNHFSVMCRFAQDCLSAMQTITKELEVKLGPDTGDLTLRVGLHSGPVVAGVLRGEKSRFQLFGDTMNTASRMESTGVSNRVQISQATADLLIEDGKEHWLIEREDKVKAKGKGELTTYFLLSVNKKSSDYSVRSKSEVSLGTKSEHNNSRSSTANGVKRVQKKKDRIADWVVEMLGKLLKEMKAKRELTGIKSDSQDTIEKLESQTSGEHGGNMDFTTNTVIDEVADVLKLPVYAANIVGSADDISSDKAAAPLDQDVMDELQDYVYSIASMYNKNAFHSFEHASHVSMSCIKLLNRIASREESTEDGTDHTYDICSDPLTSFAIVFSALIHDVDHTGVPNVQLVKEHSPVASIYKNKSVAEQNSIDVGWRLLMKPSYRKLRRHIYTTVAEYKCFRQLVVNAVMATDICDKDLIKARNQRWDLAFSTPNNSSSNNNDSSNVTKTPDSQFESVRRVNNHKGTVVIEHLIQLSDVAHTMQHWHIYRRWNERLFEESYVAYADCRSDTNPADNWYQGELGFYDFYIIPLAKKIQQCQVFGVSSDEYLSYAIQNRAEWEERGKEIVEEMAKKMDAIHHAKISRQLLQLEMAVGESGQS